MTREEIPGSTSSAEEYDSPVLVTGAAGFIGYHVSKRLLEAGRSVVGLDDLNDYYDVRLKEARLAQLTREAGFRFIRLDIVDRKAMRELFASGPALRVIHLAARPGVRQSLLNPDAYAESNLVGFLNVLEGCRQAGVGHLIYASTSAIYGLDACLPSSPRDHADRPASLYAATKRANELMAHSYAHLYGLPCTGLRFFTVYGPWARPDMALAVFTGAILEGRPVKVFNNGQLRRDFTYVGDVAECVARLLDRIPCAGPDAAGDTPDPNPGMSLAPCRVYNVGSGQAVPLLCFIEALERALGKEAQKLLLPMQPGDVLATQADIDDLARETGFRPTTTVDDGIGRFVEWYRDYYKV